MRPDRIIEQMGRAGIPTTDLERQIGATPARRLEDSYLDALRDSSERFKEGIDKMQSGDSNERENGKRIVRGSMLVALLICPYDQTLYKREFLSGRDIVADPVYSSLGIAGIERDVMKEIIRDQEMDVSAQSRFSSALDSISSQDNARRFFGQVFMATELQERMRKTGIIDETAGELAETIIGQSKIGVHPPVVALVAAASEVAKERGVTAVDILYGVTESPNTAFPVPKSVINAFGLQGVDATNANLESIANRMYAGIRRIVTGSYASLGKLSVLGSENLTDSVIANASSPDTVDRDLGRIRQNLDILGILTRIANGEDLTKIQLRSSTQ